jgi:hypothetical protein
MLPENLAMGKVFFQIDVGILVNSTLLFHYLLLGFAEKCLMTKDQILKQSTFVISLVVISRGISKIQPSSS